MNRYEQKINFAWQLSRLISIAYEATSLIKFGRWNTRADTLPPPSDYFSLRTKYKGRTKQTSDNDSMAKRSPAFTSQEQIPVSPAAHAVPYGTVTLKINISLFLGVNAFKWLIKNTLQRMTSIIWNMSQCLPDIQLVYLSSNWPANQTNSCFKRVIANIGQQASLK